MFIKGRFKVSRKVLECAFFTVLFFVSHQTFAQVSPDVLFGELFHAVQLKPVFADSKTFPDCIPIYPPEETLRKYKKQKNKKGFDLKTFVLENFHLPEIYSSGYKRKKNSPIKKHIDDLWPVLTRPPDSEKGSLIPLPNPYVVPGGRFGEIYYWDSYFTMLGLQVTGKHELIKNMVDNFSYLINKFGFIPNGNRSYYTSRSQPPFYSLMLRMLAELEGDSILEKYLTPLESEYNFWMRGVEKLNNRKKAFRRVVLLPDKTILNRYWDDRATPRPEAYKEDIKIAHNAEIITKKIYRDIRAACESGWDFSSRWFKDKHLLYTIHTTEIVPVDLNSLMYHLETTLAEIYALKGDKGKQKYYLKLANKRKLAILKYCWSKKEQFFMDYNFIEGNPTNIPSLASLFPLFFKIASKKEAKAVARRIEKDFLKPGGLVTTLKTTGQQWDAPNGWAPLQWIAIKALRHYGFINLSNKIKERWIKLNIKAYKSTGKLVEKYNVINTNLKAVGGEYPLQDGFGWTNGVLLKLLSEDKD